MTATPARITLVAPAPNGYDARTLKTFLETSRGYFSVTGEIGDEAFGCLHDEILAANPALKDLVALHLSDVMSGEPMHAEANGFYWLAKAAGIKMQWGPDQDQEACFEIFCKHCRIEADEAQAIVDSVAEAYDEGKKAIALSLEVTEATKAAQHKYGHAQAVKAWRGHLDLLRPRWERQAQEGRASLRRLREAQQRDK